MATVQRNVPDCETLDSSQKLRLSWDWINFHLQRLGLQDAVQQNVPKVQAGLQATWKSARALASEAFFNLCSPADVLNKLAPSEGIAAHTGIIYGRAARQKLDLYVPAPKKGRGAVPVVVFFHGGSWMTGERSIYRFLGAAFAASGVMAIIPDYRLYPEVTFPGFMHDAADAVAWAQSHVSGYGGDASHIFLMGHSAGAQIATLLSLDDTYLKRKRLAPTMLSGVIGLAGPYDFLPQAEPYTSIFGPEKGWPMSQPINYVSRRAPPMFLATAQKDDLVCPGNTERLAARLRGESVDTVVKVYPRAGHMTIVGAFASQLDMFAPVRNDVVSFIAARTRPQRDVITTAYRRKMISPPSLSTGFSGASI